MNGVNNEITVSVIVPCYNYAQFLGEALNSVLAQTYTNWECIIINDGSPDNTEEVAMEYCKKDSRIKYFYKENGGHSSARNFGIQNSSGKYILPLDPDDKISEVYLEKAVDVLENKSAIKLVTGQIQLFGKTNEKIVMPEYSLRSFLIINFLCISSLFRKTDYDKTNGFDETMLGFEDWDFFISILKDGGGVVELPFTGLYYRKKDKSIFSTVQENKELIFRDQLKLYNNHKDIYEKYFGSPIDLIQENEKMSRVIKAYQQTPTYRLGLRFNKLKGLFSKK